MKKIALIAFCATGILPNFAHAADPASPTLAPTDTVQRLTDLHNQIAILTQELAIAKLKTGIAQNGGSPGASSDEPNGAVAAAPTPAPSQLPPTPLPTIYSITGAGSHLNGILSMPDGSQLVVSPGTALPGGLLIHDISPTGIQVMQAGNLVPLSFSDGTTTITQSTTTTRPNPVPSYMTSPGAVPPYMPSMANH